MSKKGLVKQLFRRLIMGRITRANKISKNEDGFVRGKVIAIEDTVSQSGKPQLEWSIGVGTAKGTTTIMRKWTGRIANPDKNFLPEDSEGNEDLMYNELTQMCLNLEVFDEEKLHSDSEIDIDLNKSLEDKEVIFKTKPSKKRRGLEVIDITTIRLAK